MNRFWTRRGRPSETEERSEEQSQERKPMLNKHGLRFRITVLLLVLLLMIGTVAGTFAWIAHNRNTGETGAQIVSDAIHLSIDSYTFFGATDWQTNDDKTQTVTAAAVLDPTQQIKLNEYDSVFGRNKHTPVYLRVVLSGDALESIPALTVTFNRANNSVFEAESVTESEGHYVVDPDRTPVAAYMSNILQVRWAQIPAIDTVEVPLTVFNTAENYNSWSAISTFTPVPSAQGSHTRPVDQKNASFSINVSNYSLAADGKAYLFFELDYNHPLVEAYLNTQAFKATGKLSKYATYDFTGDLTLVSFTTAS